MNAAGGQAELERLRLAVGEQLGFAFEAEQLEQLGHAVNERRTKLGLPDVNGYLERLGSPLTRAEEVGELAELLTVTETFFYRNPDQIRAFVDIARSGAAKGQRRLRVLSAGCASGEEPYSLAIALREAIPNVDAWDVQILAVDVNPAMLAKAKRARYSHWSLRSTPDQIRSRYFDAGTSDFGLAESVRRMVELRSHNLADGDALLLRGFPCDVIFCRNVIMYFTAEVMRRVVARLTDALAPGGHLFLGHAETLRGLSHDYHLCHTHGTFYYQRRESGSERLPVPELPRRELVETNALLPGVADAGSWFEAIQAASRRITELTNGSRRSPLTASTTATPSLPPRRRSQDLGPVLDLMRAERFKDARALLEALPPEVEAQADALLFSAVLFTNEGRVAEAEAVCARLLDTDELNAGAHYVKALCREHAGDMQTAAEHDRIAVHLDSTFAMPHLHAGLMAKRVGDALAARRELGQALVLLEREDTSRLVLFGGGFSREALTALCRRELANLGATL